MLVDLEYFGRFLQGNRPPMTGPCQPDITFLAQRAGLLRQLRSFFDSRSFLEVQPPCLSRDCIVDPFLDPIEISSQQFQLSLELPARYFLQTSPEAAMKRMLAAGAASIYSIGPVFRAGEWGDQHNLEFTMLEWYDVGADLDAGVELLGSLAVDLLDRDGFDVCTYRQLFRDLLDIDPIQSDLAVIQSAAGRIDSHLTQRVGDDRDALLDILLSQAVGPSLGSGRPLIVKNYPLSQAALARTAPDDPHCAARFELFVDGVELANGYDELRDADVLEQRFQRNNETRHRLGRHPLPIQSAFLDAMRAGLPACTGVALGVDRLMMIVTGAESIRRVTPFSIDSA